MIVCAYCGGIRDVIEEFGGWGTACYDCIWDGVCEAVHADRLVLDSPPEATPAGRFGGFETADAFALFMGAAAD